AVIGLDTNILIRLLVRDDPGQTALAERLLQEAADNGEPCFISDPVLCEVEWVLESNYRAKRGDVLAAVQELLAGDLFVFEDREILREAIVRYQESKADFSDCLIGAKARARGARTTYTFERVLAQKQGFTRLV
ncbi:MAG TPA: type II toxin-antitoxin system VapC family toxin, partial [Thermoanaerobaculia bacterium]|nr:type II toxin-antitoxin system VapC family toxin [Thermoanaerobaculia bacterium]